MYNLLDNNYKITKGKENFDYEEVKSLFTDYFKDYDYILGDYSYGRIRLKDFYDSNNKKVRKLNDIKYLDKYIIKGNEQKNSVSLIVIVHDGKYLENLNKIALEKDIKLSFVVDVSVLENNLELFIKLYDDGHDILFGGSNKEDLKKYISIMKNIDKNSEKYCVYVDNDVIDICESEKINSSKSEIFIEKNYLMNIKDFVEKGNLIILKENEYLVKELSASINFIRAKGINIKSVSAHLDEKE